MWEKLQLYIRAGVIPALISGMLVRHRGIRIANQDSCPFSQKIRPVWAGSLIKRKNHFFSASTACRRADMLSSVVAQLEAKRMAE